MSDVRALDVRELTVARGSRTVLRGISLEARFGEITSVLGPNGAGKSTLLRALCGLIDYQGKVWLEGAPLDTLGPLERAKRMSFVPQHSQLTAAMPVHQLVAQGRYAHRPGVARLGREDLDATRAAMLETDLLALAERRFSELSFGEQKRALIARALATGARTLLLDEPTASLDIEHALRLFTLLRRLAAQGRCILVVLHQLDEARKFSDAAALIKAGELIGIGPSRSVISAEQVRALYGVELIEAGGLGFRLPDEAP